MLTLRTKLKNSDYYDIKKMLTGGGFFSEDEQKIALELVDETLNKPETSTYEFILAELDNKLLAYVCFGKIPCTVSSYDLYWIVVDEELRGSGIGSKLLLEAENKVKEAAGLNIYIETSSRELYSKTRAFYLKNNYEVATILKNFYSKGDDKYVFVKTI